jgi:Lung seven transmembrane receptor
MFGGRCVATVFVNNPYRILQQVCTILLFLFGNKFINSVHGGIIKYDLMLLPKSGYIQFDNGVIRAPGTIDLSDLTFTISSDSTFHQNSKSNYSTTTTATTTTNILNNVEELSTDNKKVDELDALRLEAAAFAQESSNARNLHSGDENDNDEESDPVDVSIITTPITTTASSVSSLIVGTTRSEDTTSSLVIDVAVFRVPDVCSKNGCDWAQSGVGKRRNDNNKLLWCCSQEAIDNNFCTNNEYGRLLINNDIFRGNNFAVTFNANSTERVQSISIYDSISAIYTSGTYIVLFSNCNENIATDVKVIGNVSWKSHHGYLPGELFPFMIFHACLLLLYTKIFSTFSFLMKQHVDNRIDTEKWIYISICMGLTEMIFRYGDYLLWNTVGTRSTLLVWVGILIGSLKHGISRCLLIMLSMGWGVTRDTLGSIMTYVALFGGVFIATDAVNYSMVVFAISRFEELSNDVHSSIVGLVILLSKLKSIIDILLVIWVLVALYKTISFLRILDQTTKLARMCHLRILFIGSVIFNICIHIVMFLTESSDQVSEGGLVQKRHAWISCAWTEANYLLILIGIAILWRPNPNARQYVYTMELPTTKTLLFNSSNSSNNNHNNDKDNSASDLHHDRCPSRNNSSRSVEGRLILSSRSNSSSKERNV